MTTVQEPVPLQAPPQPPNVEPPVGEAVSVTVLPLAKFAPQVSPQAMPGGLLVTVPLPVLLTRSSTDSGAAVNSALTVRSPFKTSEQAPVPLQSPLHPVKVALPDGTAVSLTVLPLGKFAEQAVPQLMPLGLLVTVPPPVPDLVTVTAVLAAALKTAVTVAFPVTAHITVPEHPPPLHPANTDPGEAEAVSVTDVPASNRLTQAPPQSIPAGVEVTVPAPVPCFLVSTLNVGKSLISSVCPG